MNIYSMHSLYVFVKIQKVSNKNDNGLLKSDFCDEEPLHACFYINDFRNVQFLYIIWSFQGSARIGEGPLCPLNNSWKK